jgi:pimeloyl-ACP methyl ester carboxylesterase
MPTFVLVHGGYHGGWCWDRLRPELTRRGHDSLAPDLPIDDPDASYPEYAAAVVEAMTGTDGDDVVLVGHSLGCFVVPLVATTRDVGALVLLNAVPTLPGEPIPMGAESTLTDELAAAEQQTFFDASGRGLQPPAVSRSLFYRDCDDESANWALARLRPQGRRPLTDAWPLERGPDVATTVVLGRDDHVVRFEPAVAAARAFLAGGDPIVLPGGHSPFLSRPEHLAEVLDGIVGSRA